ncbi:MAG: hypothetical protein KDE00_13190 [Rhodobacteraceae bacterium]|nr:hypothetical protein [Paracoccaceae bacterium]
MLRALFLATAFLAGGPAEAALRLLMVEQPGCAYCARWNAEIAPIYPKTPEGQAAPLERVQLRGPYPADLVLGPPPVFTPTFILVQDGKEAGRIEGYPGEDFFWGLLGQMIEKADPTIGTLRK